jgi:SAM-dependent methyltransferase
MLAEARKKPGARARLVHADASHLPFPDEFADLSVCSFALSYFQDLEGSLGELSRITRRTGRVLISDLHSGAVASGWTRGFRVGTERYEIAHSRHGIADVHAACKSAGLRVIAQKEAGFGSLERSVFVAAGKEHVYSALLGKPAVHVLACARI